MEQGLALFESNRVLDTSVAQAVLQHCNPRRLITQQ
jgi:hypothetical protein